MMRALSLWQPYASAVALGLKEYETRGRLTHVRGRLAIHAAKSRFEASKLSILLKEVLFNTMTGLGGYHPALHDYLFSELPAGQVIAVVNLWQCFKAHKIVRTISFQESLFGDYKRGRYAWGLCQLTRLKEPVPCMGRQGFFFLPADVEAKVRAQL